jgi:pilus assembly protein CpaB
MNPLRSLFFWLSRIPLPVIVLVIGVMAAGVTTLTVAYVHEQEAKRDEAIRKANEAILGDIIHVVKTVKDIPEDTMITSDALEEKQTRGRKTDGTLADASLAVGRITKYALPVGSIVTFGDLKPIQELTGIEARLKEGFRAVTFPVDATSGVAGFVGPGSRVDILASAGAGNETNTGCILSDVEVIAVGDTTQRASSSAIYQTNSITVAVSSTDTTKLIKAQVASGKLYMALRNQRDHAPIRVVDVTALYKTPVAQINQSSIPFIPRLERPVTQAVQQTDDQHSVEMISGTKKDTVTVPAI